MNSKQKLLTFTAIGTIFATAIATITLIGSKNLQELRAGNGESLTITFTGANISNYDKTYGYFVLSTKTPKSNDDFTTRDNNSSYAYSDGELNIGTESTDYIVSMTGTGSYDYCGAFSVNFLFKGPGTYVDGYVVYSKGSTDESEHFTSKLEEGGLDLLAVIPLYYGETSLVVKTIVVSYTC